MGARVPGRKKKLGRGKCGSKQKIESIPYINRKKEKKDKSDGDRTIVGRGNRKRGGKERSALFHTIRMVVNCGPSR